MLNSGEINEIVTLKALEILIMVDKDYNEDKELNTEFKEFYAELKTFANSFSKEVNKGRFKKKIDKFFKTFINLNKNGENLRIALPYLICFIALARFQKNNRDKKLNSKIYDFFYIWEDYLESLSYAIADQVGEDIIADTEKFAYRLLETLE